MIPIFCICIDPALFRPDTGPLTDQMRMEILLSDCPDKTKAAFQDANGDFIDVCSLNLITCDTENNIKHIRLQSVGLRGSVSFDILPQHLEIFSVSSSSGKGFTGTVCAASLPRSLHEFSIGRHEFFGSVDFSEFPEPLLELNLSNNHFTGSVDLCPLPKHLTEIHLDGNDFSGTIDFSHLPSGLVWAFFNFNKFSGSVSISCLPDSLIQLDLKGNKLEGELIYANISKNLEMVNLRKNAIVPPEGYKKLKWLKIDKPKVGNA